MDSKKKKSKSKRQNDEIVDERFVAATNRPQFQKPKAQASKVVLDERFACVLTDPRFRVQEKDKYGRKTKKQSEEQTEELSAFYMIEKDEEKQNEDDDRQSEESDSKKEEPAEERPTEESDQESSKNEDPAARIKYLTALSRGELSVSSSSDEEMENEDDASDSSDEEGEDAAVYGKAGVLDPSSRQEDEVPLTEIPSPYIAVMDMDWKHVRAVDLFAVLASFTAPGGVRRVQIFPSNYGLERMAKESVHGPSDLWKKNRAKSNEEEEDDDQSASDAEPMKDSEDDSESLDDQKLYLKQLHLENEKVESDFDTEKLREYEASKLKYYFAIVEFSSNENADKAYKEVDGLELEHSSAAMDLRSIPPDKLEGVVKDRKPRDEATMIPSNYQPPDFVVNALQQSSVQCTWEDGDEERQRKLTSYNSGQPGAWGALAEQDDLRAYVASDASSDEEEAENDSEQEGDKPCGKASRLRTMLGLEGSGDESEGEDKNESSSDEEEENDFSKQVTFIPGQEKLKDKIRSKLESKHEKELTPWEKYQEKRKEKRRELRQAHRKLRNGTGDSKGSGQGPEDDDMYGSDPEFGRAEFDSADENAGEGDDFFLETTERKAKSKKGKINSNPSKKSKSGEDQEGSAPSTKEELELLLAGDNGKSRVYITRYYEMCDLLI
jgi:hypothetical protein